MNKEKIRKALSKVGIASLAASVGLFTSALAKAGTSCGKGSCSSKKVEEPKKADEPGKASCGAGMKKGETTPEEMKGQETKEETDAKKKKKMEEGKSSCGKGSCGSK